MDNGHSANHPLVSAVIPTRNRPELVRRAVCSALSQTYPNLEIVVVVDGIDTATVETLEALNESRVRIVALTENVGGGEARNIGVHEARGEWIALLDDDDEWLPKKTERQMEKIQSENREILFCATQYIDKKGERVIKYPALFPTPSQPISEYLFCGISYLGRRETFLQTSTWMGRRSFFIDHPFTPGLKRNQDSDWLIRTFRDGLNKAAFVPEPLAIFEDRRDIKRISTSLDWEYNYHWAQRNAELFTTKSYAFYLMTGCAVTSAQQGAGMGTLTFLWSQCDKSIKRSPRLMFCFVLAMLHRRGVVFNVASFLAKFLRGKSTRPANKAA
jgi:glycosyltransferase involved in cell wall biosynthesis